MNRKHVCSHAEIAAKDGANTEDIASIEHKAA